MKKNYVIITMFTLIVSFVAFGQSVLATNNSGETSVTIGFVKDTEVKPDKPTVVPPTGGDSTTTGGHHSKPPESIGRLPQTGELVNYWLVFNGCLFILMLLFILGITRNKEDEREDIYTA